MLKAALVFLPGCLCRGRRGRAVLGQTARHPAAGASLRSVLPRCTGGKALGLSSCGILAARSRGQARAWAALLPEEGPCSSQVARRACEQGGALGSWPREDTPGLKGWALPWPLSLPAAFAPMGSLGPWTSPAAGAAPGRGSLPGAGHRGELARRLPRGRTWCRTCMKGRRRRRSLTRAHPAPQIPAWARGPGNPAALAAARIPHPPARGCVAAPGGC